MDSAPPCRGQAPVPAMTRLPGSCNGPHFISVVCFLGVTEMWAQGQSAVGRLPFCPCTAICTWHCEHWHWPACTPMSVWLHTSCVPARLPHDRECELDIEPSRARGAALRCACSGAGVRPRNALCFGVSRVARRATLCCACSRAGRSVAGQRTLLWYMQSDRPQSVWVAAFAHRWFGNSM